MAWGLQTELSRVQRSRLEAIIDRCCTEIAAPDRIHRIESLTLDLGRIDPAHLESTLAERVELALRKALTDRLRVDEGTLVDGGRAPDTSSDLELLTLFARTGTLPWWADTALPRVVDDVIERMYQSAPGQLAALLQTLVGNRRHLQRMILNATDASLIAAFAALRACARADLAGRELELKALLGAPEFIGLASKARLRSALWLGVLSTACADGGREPLPFWRDTLTRAALDLGITFGALVIAVGATLDSEPLAAVAAVLLREVQEAAPESQAAIRAAGPFEDAVEGALAKPAARLGMGGEIVQTFATGSTEISGLVPPPPNDGLDSNRFAGNDSGQESGRALDGADADLEEADTILSRLEATGLLPPALLAEFRLMAHRLSRIRRGLPLDGLRSLDRRAAAAGLRAELLKGLRELPHSEGAAGMQEAVPAATRTPNLESFDRTETLSRSAEYSGRTSSQDLDQDRAIEAAAQGTEEDESVLDRIARLRILPKTLMAELRSLVRRSQSLGTDAATRAFHGFDPGSLDSWPGDPDAVSTILRWLRGALASSPLSTQALKHSLEELQEAAANMHTKLLHDARELLRRESTRLFSETRNPSWPRSLPQLDPNEVHVENAGLVILWPFIGHFFERLELTTPKKQFKDRDALHRAVGLLQHLATQDLDPPEYQLVLAKVLCGMKLDDVFELGPPITEAEAEECTNVLQAVIASAPILRDMSVAGFRGSFLVRKGVLRARDGTWLLRVERASYDVVLDRFPWGIGWINLPWMEAPLSVEW
jgi:hypothetical protein